MAGGGDGPVEPADDPTESIERQPESIENPTRSIETGTDGGVPPPVIGLPPPTAPSPFAAPPPGSTPVVPASATPPPGSSGPRPEPPATGEDVEAPVDHDPTGDDSTGDDESSGPGRGVVVGAILAGLVVIGGVVVGLSVLGGDDGGSDTDARVDSVDPSERDEDDGGADFEPEATVSVEATTTVDVTTSVATTAPPTTATDVAAAPDGSALGAATVRLGAFGDPFDDAALPDVFTLLAAGDESVVASPVASTQLCGAVALDAPLSVTSRWELDAAVVREVPDVELAAPTGGDCLTDLDGLAAGSYQLIFTAADGTESPVVTVTVGSEATTQTFVNDLDIDLCGLAVAPTSTGFYETIVAEAGAPLVASGGSITLPVATVEHEVRPIDCADELLDGFFFVPGVERALSGAPPPAVPVTDDELIAAFGLIGSSVQPLDDAGRDAVVDLLLAPDAPLVVASDEPSRLLCSVFDLVGSFEGAIVWEFDGAVLTITPVSSPEGRIVECISPAEDTHPVGAYQAYLVRDDVLSGVATYTVGRPQTSMSFLNDTGTEVCDVGFSPDLTNFFTFFSFVGSDAFGEPLQPGETFQITAPFTENDIRAFDCDGEIVAEAFGVPPTDQVVSLSTGDT